MGHSIYEILRFANVSASWYRRAVDLGRVPPLPETDVDAADAFALAALAECERSAPQGGGWQAAVWGAIVADIDKLLGSPRWWFVLISDGPDGPGAELVGRAEIALRHARDDIHGARVIVPLAPIVDAVRRRMAAYEVRRVLQGKKDRRAPEAARGGVAA